jgi:hypothetical protein
LSCTPIAITPSPTSAWRARRCRGRPEATGRAVRVPVVDLTDARTEDVNERLDRMEQGMAKLHGPFDRLSKAMKA